jgi:hypothetical protein
MKCVCFSVFLTLVKKIIYCVTESLIYISPLFSKKGTTDCILNSLQINQVKGVY